MAELVGLARNISIDWLHAVAECRLCGDTRQEAAEKLNALIGLTINAKDNIRKIRTILLRIWYDADEVAWKVAEQKYRTAGADGQLAIHWAMMLMEYPVFVDLCNVIGHMFDMRDEISTALIREKMYEKWGERNTLFHSLSKNIQTLKDMDALVPMEKPGVYQNKKHIIADEEIAGLLLYSVLKAQDKKYLSWEGFVSSPLLYPFTIVDVNESDMVPLSFLEASRFDGTTVFSVAE